VQFGSRHAPPGTFIPIFPVDASERAYSAATEGRFISATFNGDGSGISYPADLDKTGAALAVN
jgi:hypothetical protein